MNTSFNISLSNPTDRLTPSNILKLEQVPWSDSTGLVTKGKIVAYLKSLMYGAEQPDTNNCELDSEGRYTCMCLAYPYYKDLVYNIDITHGEIGERVITEFQFTELINLTLSDESRLKYPAQSVVTSEFIGPGYDAKGNITGVPRILVDGDEIKLSEKIYGSLKITYSVIAHGYAVTVPKREDAQQNLYSSVLYAHWNGGVSWIILEPPVGAEEFAKMTAECGRGGGSGSVTETPSEWTPTANPVHQVVHIDYCSQTIKSTSNT